MNATTDETHEQIEKLSSAIKFLTISFVLMVLVYAVVYVVARNTVFIYAVVPFVLAFWVSVIRLSWLAYGSVMATVSVLGIVFPPSLLLIMLLSYSRASSFLKKQGVKLSLMGSVARG